jgi:small subunit ribosomal protein S4
MVSMDKKLMHNSSERKKEGSATTTTSQKSLPKKTSEYGRQLRQKQQVKQAYGMRERQFARFFDIALHQREGATGENLLSLLERRLDNVVFRLKFAKTRKQARQMVSHGHIFVNNARVHTASYLVSVQDVIGLDPRTEQNDSFVEAVIDKRLKVGIKTPDWLELDKKNRVGYVLRNPVRADIQMPVEEHLIVELYSK